MTIVGLLAGGALLAGLVLGPRTPPDRAPLVVIYLIDTLRRDRLGVYGYDAVTTPQIDALARECTVFDRAYAPAPWTLPSIVSLLTSRDPLAHGVLTRGQRIDETTQPLAARLRDAGWRTGCFVTNPFAGEASGLDRGCEHHERIERERVDAERVAAWLDRGSGPAFVYLHSTEPHRPFRAPSRFLERVGPVSSRDRTHIERRLRLYRRLVNWDFRHRQAPGGAGTERQQAALRAELAESAPILSRLYDAEVAWADENLGRFVRMLRDSGRWASTFFVLTSDHGEELLDHGDVLHGQSLYAELVRVPLLVCEPGGRGGGRRVEEVVSLVDVMPSVLAHVGLPIDGLGGRDLAPLLAGTEDPRAPQVTSVRLNRHLSSDFTRRARGNLNVSVDDRGWRGIWNVETDAVELYDTRADPQEQRDRAADEPERAAALGALARQWAERRWPADVGPQPSRTSILEPATVEKLRDLGYLD